ncbi:hypothetical protein OIU76_001908 [Salix suchowensis]|nr:hypothetical protein OIU76_001908 [Salix suchowensis]
MLPFQKTPSIDILSVKNTTPKLSFSTDRRNLEKKRSLSLAQTHGIRRTRGLQTSSRWKMACSFLLCSRWKRQMLTEKDLVLARNGMVAQEVLGVDHTGVVHVAHPGDWIMLEGLTIVPCLPVAHAVAKVLRWWFPLSTKSSSTGIGQLS